ncbi:phosphotransferase [Tessaracoccus sp. MC1679]|jgi:tRNA A-37 threonylcarbamoyl transferase component Bud32|uniref:phosphotransferase n=1 Tax=Tessaracoccus sp. MC1679 TaxID=2760313 RepID=UPI0016026EC9|nr:MULTISPECIES: phosphotransferase [Propionibacteriales]MBB1514660.1 phosphotransferase [Tessaracoccus sp. MC1679]
MEETEALDGGNTSGDVVRVGDTVRKPWLATTPRVVAFMKSLREGGIDVPGTHGRDEQGRLVLDFVPGTMAIDLAPLPLDVVRRVGSLIRSIHDVSARLPVPADWPEGLLPARHADLICHNDLATWNLVIDGDRLVFIDWDGAAPSSRPWDVAYAAIAFGHLFPGADVRDSCDRLAAFAEGYDADQALREQLPALMVDRSVAMYELLRTSHEIGREPWASMYPDFHGDHWLNTTQFIQRHQADWSRVLQR